MTKILVFGHQNPDTDTIAAAIAMAYLTNEKGGNAEAVALGEPNEETKYALNKFGFVTPRIITSAKLETTDVMLVDHNEAQQSVADIKDVNILSVVDHHRIANFETANPLYYRAEPVGCTCTILLKMFKENNIVIPENIAGMMLSAIISDTLLYQSPTCTAEDIAAAKELASIAKVDDQEYGLAMLKAGTNNATKSEAELINLDAKSFDMGNNVVRIAQINTVDEQEILERKQALEAEMTTEMANEGYNLFVVLITNILTSDSTIVVTGEPKENVEAAFKVTLEDNTALLKGVVSRKKQVVPPLTESFDK